MSAPMLINLPPPPSDPNTPSEIPGTPNSTTTSLSALSTTAIKDGHQGHLPTHSHHTRRTSSTSNSSQTTLDAERADRISRLAGLERVATARAGGGAGQTSSLNPQSAAFGHGGPSPYGPGAAAGGGYFDPTGAGVPPHMLYHRERSTVGSASATGSVGARTTTWASTTTGEAGSDIFSNAGGDFHTPGGDKMSVSDDHGLEHEHEHDTEHEHGDADSISGFSDEGNASLVGFGEGANSTVSGPVSTAAMQARMAYMLQSQTSSSSVTGAAGQRGSIGSASGFGSPTLAKMGLGPGSGLQRQDTGGSAMSGVENSGLGMSASGSGSGLGSGSGNGMNEARMMDGMTYDANVTDTASRAPRRVEDGEY